MMMRLWYLLLAVAIFGLGAGAGHALAAGTLTILHKGARVEMIADDTNGRLLVSIDGQNAAFIDTAGLHVRNGLNFGGSIQAYGQQGFDALVKDNAGKAHAR